MIAGVFETRAAVQAAAWRLGLWRNLAPEMTPPRTSPAPRKPRTVAARERHSKYMARLRMKAQREDMSLLLPVAKVPPDVMRMCREEADREGIPANAVLSRSRFRKVVMARNRVFERALGRHSQEALARMWGMHPSAIWHALHSCKASHK